MVAQMAQYNSQEAARPASVPNLFIRPLFHRLHYMTDHLCHDPIFSLQYEEKFALFFVGSILQKRNEK